MKKFLKENRSLIVVISTSVVILVVFTALLGG